MDKYVIITTKVVLTTLAILFVLSILYVLAPIFAIVFIALFLVLALEPAVQYFKRVTFMNKSLSRSFAVALTFLVFIVSIIFIISVGLPPVILQAQKLLLNLSGTFAVIPGLEDFKVSIADLLPQIGDISEGLISTTFSVFSNVIGVLSVLFLSVYMSLDWENIKSGLIKLFPTRTGNVISSVVEEIEDNIGLWVKGQLFLMFVIGLVSFFGLLILGVDFPLALGLIAGLLEIVPVLGPVIAAVLAAIVGFAISPAKGLGVIVLFLVIQQLENNFLVPKVMQKVTGFSPLVILIALLVGSKFFGIVGAIIAIPFMMIMMVVIRRVLRYSS